MLKKMNSFFRNIWKNSKKIENQRIPINIITGGNLDICDKFVMKYQNFIKNHSFPNLIVIKENDEISNNDEDDEKNIIDLKLINTPSGCSNMLISYDNNLSMNKLFDYLDKNDYYVNCLIHLNHKVLLEIPDNKLLNLDSTTSENEKISSLLREIKSIVKVNIENPFIFNNNLINKRNLINKTKICHLNYQNPSNVNISKYLKYNKIFIDMFNLLKSKHLDLLKNKEIDLKLINIRTIDSSYIDYLKLLVNNKNDKENEISEENVNNLKQNINLYEKNHDKALDFLIYLCDPTNTIKKATIDIENI